MFLRLQHIARFIAPALVVATLLLAAYVRPMSASLGAGSICTHQIVGAADGERKGCCTTGERKRPGENDRGCCATGLSTTHCMLTALPALRRLHLAGIAQAAVVLPPSTCEGTLAMPTEPLLRPPIGA